MHKIVPDTSFYILYVVNKYIVAVTYVNVF